MRLDASALVSDASKASGSCTCSDSVLRYDACAPVIGSSPDTHSSGGFSVLDRGSGSIFGLSWGGAAFTFIARSHVLALFFSTLEATAGSERVVRQLTHSRNTVRAPAPRPTPISGRDCCV